MLYIQLLLKLIFYNSKFQINKIRILFHNITTKQHLINNFLKLDSEDIPGLSIW